ncbi:hypothetical protein [Mucilaginibacter lappiensis]|uniref:Uncharacterized protein n=1 Tax=Mucilaginibacter lappiensis TaxID=354630 RepID=A0A841JJX6_9SPHI|nr:hypothetical protein [Mucilaginibacter lappiensis]MBB6130582.1 hypothetical protein [Mucilaginibacter lappiensis]
MRTLFSIFLFLFCQQVFSQTKPIEAKEAYKYVNQIVTIKDDIYSSKIYKDSLAVLELGKPGNEHHFSIILIKNTKAASLDEKVIKTLKVAKASFTGLVVSNEGGALMIVEGTDKIKFNYRVD